MKEEPYLKSFFLSMERELHLETMVCSEDKHQRCNNKNHVLVNCEKKLNAKTSLGVKGLGGLLRICVYSF